MITEQLLEVIPMLETDKIIDINYFFYLVSSIILCKIISIFKVVLVLISI